MNDSRIEDFVDGVTLNAMADILSVSDEKRLEAAACSVVNAFGLGDFSSIANPAGDGENKLIASFNNNLMLLIQKTWVEKSDVDLKAQVLYHLEQFIQSMKEKDYDASYPLFFSIVDDVVYLMFGAQTKTKEFDDYALRIDPEFGIFWWYIKNLPRNVGWSQEKMRLATLIGMYFLANY